MSVPTLLDIAKLDAGIGYPLIEEAVKMAPELTVVPADTMTRSLWMRRAWMVPVIQAACSKTMPRV